jgi:hypothetical protein
VVEVVVVIMSVAVEAVVDLLKEQYLLLLEFLTQ